MAVVVAINKRSPAFLTTAASRAYVSRKSPNTRRRKRQAENPCGIQARDRREICAEILHHKSGRNCCSSVSLRGMGADRAEVGGSIDFQSDKEEIFNSHELLRAGRGDGRAGAPAGTADPA